MAQLDFRDGPREVPDHLVGMLQTIDTRRMTYEQAIEAANKKLVNDEVGRKFDQVIAQHFRDLRMK